MRALLLALAYLPVYAATQYPAPSRTLQSPNQSQHSSHLQKQPMGCSDPRPFHLNYTKWWRCSSDAMNCYDKIVMRVLKNVHSGACANDTCLAPSAPGYNKTLSKHLNDSLSKQERLPADKSKPCPWSKWTHQMDFVANVILQKSERCQVDHVAIFVLFDATRQLLKQEERCSAAGMSDNRTKNDILEGILDQRSRTTSNRPRSKASSGTIPNTSSTSGWPQSGSSGNAPIVKAGQ